MLVNLKTELRKAEIRDQEERVKLAEAQMDSEIKRLIRKKIELDDILSSIEKNKAKKQKL